jgi:hypothetical protein
MISEMTIGVFRLLGPKTSCAVPAGENWADIKSNAKHPKFLTPRRKQRWLE